MKARRHYPFTPFRLLPGLLLLLVALVVVGSTIAEPSAATLYVSPSGSDAGGANSCADPATPCATIRHALGRSLPGDTIRPAAGTYLEAGLVIPHAVALIGEGAAAVTLDGGHAATVLIIAPDVATTIEGLTIRNGLADRGGAIRVERAGSLTLRRAVLEGNRADAGGAVYLESGLITVEDSRLSGNAAVSGGAIYVEGGALALVRSEVGDNNAELGGGLELGPGASAVLRRVTLHSNTAARLGGAIHTTGSLALANSLLRDNTAGATGGGLYNDDGVVTADYTTWIGNTAPVGASIAGRGQTNLNYSILTGDGACNGVIAGNGNLIDDADCGLPVQPAGGLLPDGRPLFDSNAVDGGPAIACPTTDGSTLTDDLRGEPRATDGDRDGSARCDPGAFEFQPRLTVIHNPTLIDDAGFDFGGDLGPFTLRARGHSRHIFEASPGSYRLEQTREPGWKLNTITCGGDADGGGLIDTTGGTVTVDLDPAESIVCTFSTRPNRDTIGVTVMTPATGAPVAFSGGLGAFELGAVEPDMRSGRLSPGVYPVQAAPPAGLRVAAITCAGDRDGGTTADLAIATALIDLDPKETISCAFALAPATPAALTIRQEATPAGTASFAYTGDLGPFALRAPSAAQTFALAPGVYRVHELLHPLWNLSRLDCVGDSDAGSILLPEEATAVIDLDAGEAITCVFSHARVTSGTGTITIVQTADPADETPFAYSGALGEFTLSPPSAASRTWAELRPSSYSIRQLLPTGWKLDTITCAGDTDGGGSVQLDQATALIDLDEGEVIACAFGNSRPSTTGAIIIVHNADPADDTQFRYFGALGGFNLRAPSRPSRSFLDLAPGAYQVGVRPLDGWTLAEMVCEGDSDGGSVIDPAGRTVTIDLDAAEAVICRFRYTGPGSITPTPTPTPAIGWRLYLPVVRR